jgi:hypothetical protein
MNVVMRRETAEAGLVGFEWAGSVSPRETCGGGCCKYRWWKKEEEEKMLVVKLAREVLVCCHK